MPPLSWQRHVPGGLAHQVTSQPPGTYARRLYYDTAVFSPVLLRRLVEDVGADHALLGTDHPFDLRDDQPLASVSAAASDPGQQRAILWDTAARLLALA